LFFHNKTASNLNIRRILMAKMFNERQLNE
jgi:hypothetical protein